MKNESLYLKVGFFVFIGLIFIGYHTIKLGKMEIFSSNGLTVVAEFSSVAGLRTGAEVEISGVSIGKVKDITLKPPLYNQAVVTFVVNKDIPITDDTIVSVKTSGLIGSKYLNLSLGGGDKYSEGMILTDTESSLDIESLISKYVFGGVK